MFIDNVVIHVKAGDGGNGCVSFRREKCVPKGGPDGGDGGKGGDIIIEAVPNQRTLISFLHRKHIKGKNGQHGKGKKMFGRNSPDILLEVPVGTVIKENNQIIADLCHQSDKIIVARGGRGGKGNAKFSTSIRRVPRIAEEGKEGEEKDIRLELRLIADVGLVGYPNSGKSTLLSRISHARPKIADYPFTTIEPLLGVVKVHDSSFVAADIPGLIEGASNGKGMGNKFLAHISRTKIILHLIDMSDENAYSKFNAINKELSLYNLGDRAQIIVANKMDIITAQTNLKDFRKKLHSKEIFAISALTGEGVKKLIYYIDKLLNSEERQI
ncbi:MAG: GTPase ObgE [bacterium]|nr:GTPase ObgE [bacterium]